MPGTSMFRQSNKNCEITKDNTPKHRGMGDAGTKRAAGEKKKQTLAVVVKCIGFACGMTCRSVWGVETQLIGSTFCYAIALGFIY